MYMYLYGEKIPLFQVTQIIDRDWHNTQKAFTMNLPFRANEKFLFSSFPPYAYISLEMRKTGLLLLLEKVNRSSTKEQQQQQTQVQLDIGDVPYHLTYTTVLDTCLVM